MSSIRRKDSNFFGKYNVSSGTFILFASWTFTSVGIALMVESDEPEDVIEYSFNGTTIHGDMVPLMPSEAIIFDNRAQSKIWLRRKTAGSTVLVRVEAWRNES